MAALRPLLNRTGLSHSQLEIEKRKMSTLFLIYSEHNQLELNQLMEDFTSKALELGVDVKLADFRDL